jgi:hypothetical protein
MVASLLIGPLVAPSRAAFSTPMKLSATGVDPPKAAIDADGDAIAVWSRQDGAKWRAEEREISATGALGPVKRLAAGDKSLYPQIAGDPGGGAIVAWTRTQGERQRIEARRISANGRLGAVKTISAPRRQARSPRIASDADGDATVVWGQHRGIWRIKARKISSTGSLGRVKTLSSATQKSKDPEIASDARGDAIAVWSQFDGMSWRIKTRRISAKGRLGSVKTLSAAGNDGHIAQVASDARGDAIAVWLSKPKGSKWRVNARRISARGRLGSVKTLSEGRPGEAQVASDARGEAAVVWSASVHSRSRIYARRISATGDFGPTQTLSSRGRTAAAPQIAIDGAGNATAVWYDYRSPNTNDWHLQARQISATGALGPMQRLAVAPISRPQIAVNTQGDAFATWAQFGGSQWSAWGSLGP